MAAARAEKQRRLVGRDARPVGGDQQVGAQRAVLVLLAELAQAGRADLFAHLDQEFDVEAEPAALRQHRGERRDVDAVLALVVGGAAAVDALALDGERPRRQSRAPQIVEPAHGVAVAVDQHGQRVRVFDALGHQERRAVALRILEHAAGEAERRERRRHLVAQIGPQRLGALRLLAGARDRDPPAQRRRRSRRRRNARKARAMASERSRVRLGIFMPPDIEIASRDAASQHGVRSEHRAVGGDRDRRRAVRRPQRPRDLAAGAPGAALQQVRQRERVAEPEALAHRRRATGPSASPSARAIRRSSSEPTSWRRRRIDRLDADGSRRGRSADRRCDIPAAR